MAQIDDRYAQPGTVTRSDASIDAGLRSYMLGVYNYMTAGLALTGIVAYLTHVATASNPALNNALYHSPLRWIVMLAPLAFVMVLSFRVHKMSVPGAQIAFWAFSAVMGLSLSWIALRYSGESIVRALAATSAGFAALSVYGYTTKKDLSGWGSFLIMGVVGLIIAGLLNLFLQSSGLQWALSILTVLIFAGLTAYDTQNIKDGYHYVRHDATLAAKSAVMGALSLYLDFINMFTSLLNLTGSSD